MCNGNDELWEKQFEEDDKKRRNVEWKRSRGIKPSDDEYEHDELAQDYDRYMDRED